MRDGGDSTASVILLENVIIFLVLYIPLFGSLTR
jgi:hypothetical protein